MVLRMSLISLALAAGLALLPQALRAGEARPNPSMVVNDGDDTWRVRDSDAKVTVGVIDFYKGNDKKCLGKPLGTLSKPQQQFLIKPHTSYKMFVRGSECKLVPLPIRGMIEGKVIAVHLSLEPVTGDDADGTGQKDYAKLHIVHGIEGGEIVKFGMFKGKMNQLLDKFNLPQIARQAFETLCQAYMDEDEAVVIEGKKSPRVTAEIGFYQDADSGALWSIDKGQGKKDKDDDE